MILFLFSLFFSFLLSSNSTTIVESPRGFDWESEVTVWTDERKTAFIVEGQTPLFHLKRKQSVRGVRADVIFKLKFWFFFFQLSCYMLFMKSLYLFVYRFILFFYFLSKKKVQNNWNENTI